MRFIDQNIGDAHGWTATLLCRLLEISRASFYQWRAAATQPLSPRRQRSADLLQKIRELFEGFKGRYGSPRIHRTLLHRGVCCCVNTVARLMRADGLIAKGKKKFRIRTTDSNHDQPIADDLLQRGFTAAEPDIRWVSDLTYIPTDEGFLYCVTVLDLFSRKVVAWATADHMRAELFTGALEEAVRIRRPRPGLIVHSDRGVQYACEAFREACERHGIRRSMSGKGDCYDNAVAESFFGSMKTEAFAGVRFATRADARLEVFEYIECFYNRTRLHSTLDYKSPNEHERQHLLTL